MRYVAPDTNVVRRLAQRLHETGSVTSTTHVHAGRPRTVRTPACVRCQNYSCGDDAISHDSWDFRNRGASKCFMTISCIYTTTHRVHMFPDNRPQRMPFCEWLWYQHTANEFFLHNILCTDEACFTREGVFSLYSNHLWALDKPQTICQRGCEVHLSVSVWAVIDGDIVVGNNLTPYRLTAQRCSDFL
jgi:hypothetical protein